MGRPMLEGSGLPRRSAAMAPNHQGLQHPRRGAACVPTTWTSTSEGARQIFRPSRRSVRILTELRHVVPSLFWSLIPRWSEDYFCISHTGYCFCLHLRWRVGQRAKDDGRQLGARPVVCFATIEDGTKPTFSRC